MFLGISTAQMLVIVGIGAIVLGRKDLVAIASAAGHLTGRAAGVLSAARQRFASFTENAELAKLHRDVQGTMLQLESIREELRRGVVPQATYSRMASTVFPAEAPPPGPVRGQQQQQAGLAPHKGQLLPPAAEAAAAAQQPATAALQAEPVSMPVSRVAPLPALSGVHFATGGDATAATAGLVGDQSFDSEAYAAYQSLFDVPAGRHAPPLPRHRAEAVAASVTQRGPLLDKVPQGTKSAAGTAATPDVHAAASHELVLGFAEFLKTDAAKQLLQQALHDVSHGPEPHETEQ